MRLYKLGSLRVRVPPPTLFKWMTIDARDKKLETKTTIGLDLKDFVKQEKRLDTKSSSIFTKVCAIVNSI